MNRKSPSLISTLGLTALYIGMVYWVPLIRRNLVPILIIAAALLFVLTGDRDAGGFVKAMSINVIEPAALVAHHAYPDPGSPSSVSASKTTGRDTSH